MRISKALRNNRDLISHMFGGLENIIATTNFNDIMDKFEEIEKKENEYNRFSTINRKLFGVNLGDDELVRKEETFNPSADYQNYKSYADWQKMASLYPKEGMIQPQAYQDFIKQNKGIYEDEYKGLYTSNEIPLTKDELTAKRFEKAGLSPEDVMFYNEYLKKKGDVPVDFNRDLTNLLTSNLYGLQSRGSRGNSLVDLAMRRATGLMRKEPKPVEWGIFTDGNKNVWQYDKNNPSNRVLITEFKEKPSRDATREQLIKSIGFKIEENKDESGNPLGTFSYYIPTENGWEKTTLDATKDEFDKYMDKLNTYEDKLSIKGNYGSTSSRKKGRKTVGFTLPKMPEDFKNISVDDVSKMTLSQLNSITSSENRKLISEDVYKAAKDRLRGGNRDELESGTENITDEGYLSSKTKQISEKIMSKKDKMDDLQKQREEVAGEFVIFKKAFSGKKYKLEDLNKSVLNYLDALEKAGYDEEVIKEAWELFDSFKAGL